MNDDHSGRFARMPILYDDRSDRYDDADADSGRFSCGVGVAHFAGAGPLVHGLGGP